MKERQKGQSQIKVGSTLLACFHEKDDNDVYKVFRLTVNNNEYHF